VCYDSALAQAPDSEHVQVGKLKLLLAAKRFDEALAITTKMLRDKSSSTAMLQVRAKCYYFQVRECGTAIATAGCLRFHPMA
jgi:hypothetical protein